MHLEVAYVALTNPIAPWIPCLPVHPKPDADDVSIGLALALVWPIASLVCYAAMPLIYLLPSRIDQQVKLTS